MDFDFFGLNKIKISIEEEKKLKEEFDERKKGYREDNKKFFEKILKAYKNFDFSVLSSFNSVNIYALEYGLQNYPELLARPMLYDMYLFYRNGFFDKYFENKDRNFDLTEKDMPVVSLSKDIPEAIITEDGMLYGIGKDGHQLLFEFLNMSGVNTNEALRFGKSYSERGEIIPIFSRIWNIDRKSPIYITDQQAIVINNIRRLCAPLTSLQDLFLNNTMNFGTLAGESSTAMMINFETFANLFPKEYMFEDEVKKVKTDREREAKVHKVK